ncbi:hypothetical protein [Castellaniella defragrans]|uniref:hypothetical protein n=1 Tax=Castellaniella defragrans TaxID=75697 RepID=UPI0011DCD46A|nr:hypothetical protein [Castellaniella defragrans]
MRVEKYIIRQFASRTEQVIVARSKRHLRQMTMDSMLSGDDSLLGNLWDEICVQQRSEKSFYWSAYVETIDEILTANVNRLDHAAVLALWSQTEAGFDWLYDHHTDENGSENVPLDYDTVIAYLRGLLLQAALDEDNESVTKYLHSMGYESDEPDQ